MSRCIGHHYAGIHDTPDDFRAAELCSSTDFFSFKPGFTIHRTLCCTPDHSGLTRHMCTYISYPLSTGGVCSIERMKMHSTQPTSCLTGGWCEETRTLPKYCQPRLTGLARQLRRLSLEAESLLHASQPLPPQWMAAGRFVHNTLQYLLKLQR